MQGWSAVKVVLHIILALDNQQMGGAPSENFDAETCQVGSDDGDGSSGDGMPSPNNPKDIDHVGACIV